MSAASFPSAVREYVDKVDYRDNVLAEHINSVQSEVTAIERVLGTRVVTSSGYVGAFDSETTQWDPSAGGLASRLQNIEYGVRGDVHAQYIRKSAQSDNVVTPAAPDTVGLTISPATAQTADLLVVGTARIDKDGAVFSAGTPVVTTTGAATLTGKTMSGTANTFTDIPATAVNIGAQAIPDYLAALPRVIYQDTLPDAVALGLPAGSIWVDSDSVASDPEALKEQIKTIVAAAADFAAFQTAIAAW